MNWFLNLKIKFKFRIVIAVIVVTAIMSIVGMYEISQTRMLQSIERNHIEYSAFLTSKVNTYFRYIKNSETKKADALLNKRPNTKFGGDMGIKQLADFLAEEPKKVYQNTTLPEQMMFKMVGYSVAFKLTDKGIKDNKNLKEFIYSLSNNSKKTDSQMKEFEIIIREVIQNGLSFKDLIPEVANFTRNSVIIMAIFMSLISILALISFRNSSISPLQLTEKLLLNISKGDFSIYDEDINKIDTLKLREDEFGSIMKAFILMSRYLKEKANVANEISKGNFNVNIKKSSEEDHLSESMMNMISSIKEMKNDVNSIVNSVDNGEFNISLNSIFQGDWKELINDIHSIVTSFAKPLEIVSNNLNLISIGESPNKIESDYKGGFLKMVNSLNELIDSIKLIENLSIEIGKGNLSIEVKERSDNDKLMKSMKSMVNNLRVVLRDIDTEAVKLFDQSQNLEVVSKGLVSSSENSKSSCSTVHSNVENVIELSKEVGYTSNDVADNTNSVSDEISRISGSIEQLTSLIMSVSMATSQAKDVSQEAIEISNKTSVTMDDLKKSGNEISNVTELIKKIAEQTNLLALNATIEAASAGEAGKGFAVVANEIKELANQSAKAAEEIEDKVTGIQKSSIEASDSFEKMNEIISTIGGNTVEIAKSIDEQSQISNEVSKSFIESSKTLSIITQEINGLSGNINTISSSVTETGSTVYSLATSAEKVDTDSKELSILSENLLNMSQKMKSIVDRFQI